MAKNVITKGLRNEIKGLMNKNNIYNIHSYLEDLELSIQNILTYTSSIQELLEKSINDKEISQEKKASMIKDIDEYFTMKTDPIAELNDILIDIMGEVSNDLMNQQLKNISIKTYTEILPKDIGSEILSVFEKNKILTAKDFDDITDENYEKIKKSLRKKILKEELENIKKAIKSFKKTPAYEHFGDYKDDEWEDDAEAWKNV